MSEEKTNHPQSETKYKTLITIGVIAVIGIAGYLVWDNYFSGFNDATISMAKDEIKREFDRREGIDVEEVNLFRDPENRNKLIGFVKANFTIPASHVAGFTMPEVKQEINKSCTATLLKDNQYMWECK